MSNKFKILMIGPDSQGGITSIIEMYLQNGLPEAEFLSSYISGNRLKHLIHYAKFLFKYVKKLLNKNNKIIHIHSSSRGSFLRKSIVLYIAKLFGKKTIFHINGSEFNIFYENSPIIVKKIITDVLDKSDIVLAVSKQWQKDLMAKSKNGNIKILYNPNSLKRIEEKTLNEDINTLFMGRLGKRKGAYDIIEAAKYLQNNNVKIIFYGDGEIEQIQKLIDKNNLNNKIELGGWIRGDDIDKAYRNADIYILPSYNEGLPMSVLEAMSYGLPVISTPVGGTPEAVEDGINGFLINPGDYKALAEKIDLLANNKVLRKQMGEESHKIINEKFDIKIILKQLQDMYNELI